MDFGKKKIEPGIMHIAPTFFGYNFTDGRIKSYPKENHPYNGLQTWCIRCVRGPVYGVNDFVDNGDGTISDRATGLMWQKTDDGKGRDWREALDYAEHLQLAGYDDWRLPDQKELHSIVDYDFIPAINPIFQMSDPKGWFWSSTPFVDMPGQAVYVAFGKATGKTSARPEDEYDVHGAGPCGPTPWWATRPATARAAARRRTPSGSTTTCARCGRSGRRGRRGTTSKDPSGMGE